MTNPIKHFFSTEAEEGYVPNRELLCYATALAGQNMTYSLVSKWIFYFCTNILHMDPGKVGNITSISRVWDALNDPIVGVVLDRRDFKPGQKLHPYLGKLPVAIGVLSALMFVNFGLSGGWAMAMFLVFYFAWDLVYSFQDTALWGTMALISPHSEERGRVSQWLNIGAGLGSASVELVSLMMGVLGGMGIAESNQFIFYGLFFGLCGELLSALAAKTKERVAFVPEEKQSFWKDFADLRHNKIMILYLLAQIVSFFDGAVPHIYFFKYCVTLTLGKKTIPGESVLFIYGILSNLLGIPAQFFSAKVGALVGGMRNVILIAKTGNIALRVLAFFIGFDSLGKFAAVTVIMNFASVFNNLTGIAGRTILCDSVDSAEYKTGKRTEGVCFSAQNFTNKLLDSIKLFVCGRILSALKFDGALSVDELRVASPQYFKAQWPIFMLLPALGSLMYLIPFLCIRYSKKDREIVEEYLKNKHGEQE